MKCKNCEREIEINSDTACVAQEHEGALDIQVRCPKCDALHYTFFPCADLVCDDISKKLGKAKKSKF